MGVHGADEATARAIAQALDIPLASLYADNPAMAKLIQVASRLTDAELAKLTEQIEKRKK